MKNLAKWLLNKIKEIELMEVFGLICKLLPIEKAIDGFCDYLATLADKTETQIDDQFVEDLRMSLKQLLLNK